MAVLVRSALAASWLAGAPAEGRPVAPVEFSVDSAVRTHPANGFDFDEDANLQFNIGGSQCNISETSCDQETEERCSSSLYGPDNCKSPIPAAVSDPSDGKAIATFALSAPLTPESTLVFLYEKDPGLHIRLAEYSVKSGTNAAKFQFDQFELNSEPVDCVGNINFNGEHTVTVVAEDKDCKLNSKLAKKAKKFYLKVSSGPGEPCSNAIDDYAVKCKCVESKAKVEEKKCTVVFMGAWKEESGHLDYERAAKSPVWLAREEKNFLFPLDSDNDGEGDLLNKDGVLVPQPTGNWEASNDGYEYLKWTVEVPLELEDDDITTTTLSTVSGRFRRSTQPGFIQA